MSAKVLTLGEVKGLCGRAVHSPIGPRHGASSKPCSWLACFDAVTEAWKVGCNHPVFSNAPIAGAHAPDADVPPGEPSSCDGRLRVPCGQVWSEVKMNGASKLRSWLPKPQRSLERGGVLQCSDGPLLQDLGPDDALAVMLGGTKPLVETSGSVLLKPEIGVSWDVHIIQQRENLGSNCANEVAGCEASWRPCGGEPHCEGSAKPLLELRRSARSSRESTTRSGPEVQGPVGFQNKDMCLARCFVPSSMDRNICLARCSFARPVFVVGKFSRSRDNVKSTPTFSSDLVNVAALRDGHCRDT